MTLQNAAQQFSAAMTYLVMKYAVHGVQFVPENELQALADAHAAFAALDAFEQGHVAYAQVDVFVKMSWQMVPGESEAEWDAHLAKVLELFEAVQEFSLVDDEEDDEDTEEVFEFTADKEFLTACLSL